MGSRKMPMASARERCLTLSVVVIRLIRRQRTSPIRLTSRTALLTVQLVRQLARQLVDRPKAQQRDRQLDLFLIAKSLPYMAAVAVARGSEIKRAWSLYAMNLQVNVHLSLAIHQKKAMFGSVIHQAGAKIQQLTHTGVI